MAKVVLMFLLVALCVGATLVQAQDATPANTSVVQAADAFVRSGPGDGYRPIGRLTAGTVVVPLRRSVDGQWVLIPVGQGVGWIRRDLVDWSVDVERLPLLGTDITPSPDPDWFQTPTPAAPTATPVGSYVQVNGVGAYLRAGPGQTYQRLGIVANGTTVEPVGRSSDRTWLLIRTPSGFAWITTRFVQLAIDLESLPVLLETALTPSNTPDPQSFTATPSVTPSFTSTATPSATPTLTVTATATATATLTTTATLTPTASPTETPTDTETPVPPSATPSETSSATVSPTLTATESPTDAPSPTTPATTAAPTLTPIALAIVPTDAPSTVMTEPSATPSPMPPTPVSTEAQPTVLGPTVEAVPPAAETTAERFPIEAVVGGTAVLAILGYIGLYLRGQSTIERYQQGFFIERCPVCGQGTLSAETRVERPFGIPRPRRLVRCNHCRSVLREVGMGRWRYAVDRIENPPLYERVNGKVITEAALISLSKQPPDRMPRPRKPVTPPTFIDDEGG